VCAIQSGRGRRKAPGYTTFWTTQPRAVPVFLVRTDNLQSVHATARGVFAVPALLSVVRPPTQYTAALQSHCLLCFCAWRRQSELSIAFVNLKPLVPGHVLVVPRRVVPRYAGLTPEEAADLWQGVLAVRTIVAKQQQDLELGFTIGMQDGPIAGQSVPHVHVHILPS
jgi:hypothetical protein